MLRNLSMQSAAAAALLSAVIPSAADAAVTFTRYDFTGVFQADAVIPEVSGFFTIRDDSELPNGTLFDVDVTIGTTRFTADNSFGASFHNPLNPIARVGGVIDPDDTYDFLATGTNDFAVVIFLADPSISYFFYTLENWAGLGQAYGQDGTFTFTATDVTPNAIPEPASWALMISGFGLVGGAMRRSGAAKISYSLA